MKASSAGPAVSGYTIDAATGVLTPISGSPFAAGSNPISVAVDPTGRFAYVANELSNNISAYTINATTGALAAIPGSPFPTGMNAPVSVAVDPTGRFVYVANTFSNNISGYTIIATTGALSHMSSTPFAAGSPFAAGYAPRSVAVDPTGKFAYVATLLSHNVSGYAINATTGFLTPIPGSPFAADTGPFSVAVHPTGRFAYVANEGLPFFPSPLVSGSTINATTGALVPIPGSPFAAGSSGLRSLAVDPTGKFAYVTNLTNVWGFTINATTGALSSITGSPFAAGERPKFYGYHPPLSQLASPAEPSRRLALTLVLFPASPEADQRK